MILDEQHDLDKAKENVYILERGLLKMLITWVLETRIKLVLICFNTATKIYRKFCNFFCSFCQMICKEYKRQIGLENVWKIIRVWLESKKYILEIYGGPKRKQNHICKKSLNCENYKKKNCKSDDENREIHRRGQKKTQKKFMKIADARRKQNLKRKYIRVECLQNKRKLKKHC